MVATLNSQGQLGVVMPHGVLFRGGAEGEIRKGFLQEDLLRGGHRPAAEPVLRHRHPGRDPGAQPSEEARSAKGKVLFIDASREFEEGTAQNYLRDEDVKKIAHDVPRLQGRRASTPASCPSTRSRRTTGTSTSRATSRRPRPRRRSTLPQAVQKLRELEKERAEAEARMNEYLKELGYAG